MSETKRRDFLRILGIGGAAGLGGCSKTAPDALVPYVKPPGQLVRGHALWFRSTCRECPAGCGIEARVREGRVHKVEGNPEHPVNGGGLCARGQAAVQGLYNPDRLRTPLLRDAKGELRPVAWDEAGRVLDERLTARKDEVAVMTGCTSGAQEEAVRRWLEARGGTRRIVYEPVACEAVREANRLSFGAASLPVLRMADARAIYLFGADVLETYVSPVGYTRGIAEARRAGARMVFAGSRLSLTGARADEWVPVPQGREGRVAMALVRELLAAKPSPEFARVKQWAEPFTPERAGVEPARLRAMAAEIARGAFLGVAADSIPTAVAVNLLNTVAGALNRTVRFDRAPALARATSRPDLAGVRAVVVADANPVYACPGFAEALRKVPFVVALTPYRDETAEAAHLVLPIHTPLESWGDYEPWTGIHSLQQPAMQPVFDTRDMGDFFAGGKFSALLRERWKKIAPDFDEALARGGYWQDVPAREVKLGAEDLGPLLAPLLAQPPGGYTLESYPSLAHFDGRGANRPWLQELPDPITMAVWDTWAEIHPKDAAALGVKTGDRVRVKSAQQQIEVAAYVYPGVYPGTVALPLGQGHTAYGRYAAGTGANAAVLGPSGTPLMLERVAGASTGLVTVNGHDLQEHRGIVRTRVTGEHAAPHHPHRELSLYKPHGHGKHRWAMAIDLDACTGCSACVTACYAENNVPVVGKAEVGRGREMSWIRMERFFGPGDRVSHPFRVEWAPVLCQQCDNAPCEPVCPVFAAYHTEEGLNGQVYNRCVGTRYCSNNCPYKTRRFNWYQAEWPAPLEWQLNPDVTARSKGVMEKCTFCVQRIVAAKDAARRAGRQLADGDVAPACAQSCPAAAITFGDLNDPHSRISAIWQHERRYRILEELNTRPAVIYLERERRLV